MQENTARTVIVTDGAAAADGGSLWIRIAVNGNASNYSLNRSLAARGTPRYNTISGEHGPLSKGERKELLALLRSIADGRAGAAGVRRGVNDTAPARRAGRVQKSLRILRSRSPPDWCVSTAVSTSVRNHGRFSCVLASLTQTRIGGAFDDARASGVASRDGTQFFACT